jgi:hypothetical protein
VPALTCDPATVGAWLRSPSGEHPGCTNAETLGVDEECFGRRLCGFRRTVENVLLAWPDGLVRRADVEDVMLWLIPDVDVLDQGALITVDLTNRVRLASLHQDIKDFADRDARGVPAAVSALAHIAAQATLVLATFQRNTPDYQAPPN